MPVRTPRLLPIAPVLPVFSLQQGWVDVVRTAITTTRRNQEVVDVVNSLPPQTLSILESFVLVAGQTGLKIS